ncbi:unnamed protein product [Choristocarpus tenellus]
MRISTKDREMELMEDNHRQAAQSQAIQPRILTGDVRVYVQKVKHLEYEHHNNLKAINMEGEHLLGKETEIHGQLSRTKKALKNELDEKYLLNAEEISQVKNAHDKNLTKMREGFDTGLQELRDRCDARLQELDEDLELRRKVDIHEIEERKNLHINDLMRNHEKAFGQMKAYYNDITNDNLKAGN